MNRDFEAKCGIYLDEDNNLQFLTHPERHQDDDECYLFMCAVFHRAHNEPEFIRNMINWLNNERKKFADKRKLQ